MKPLLKRHCVRCHNADKMTSGIRVDPLDAALEDRHHRLLGWIERTLAIARSRRTPNNGSVRRLIVAQYRNALRELLQLEENLTDVLPPDAVSRDGCLNNRGSGRCGALPGSRRGELTAA